MASIRLLSGIEDRTIDGFTMPPCLTVGCDCDLRLNYGDHGRPMGHYNIGDTLVIGTHAQVVASTADVDQIVADAFIVLNWAELV